MTTGCGAPIDKAPNARARHISVLIDEAMTALDYKRGGRYIDATFGAGGYTQRLLSVPNVHVLALDRDPSAIRAGADVAMSGQGRARLVEARFSQLEAQARAQDFMPVDGVVFDIGVSSMQFDEAARGFSFRGDGPLDMRMEIALSIFIQQLKVFRLCGSPSIMSLANCLRGLRLQSAC